MEGNGTEIFEMRKGTERELSRMEDLSVVITC